MSIIYKTTKMENIDSKIESILNSIDGLQKAEADPFFHTRVQARLEKRRALQPENKFLIRRPALIIATLSILLAANIFLITAQQKSSSNEMNKTNEIGTLQDFANTYGLNSSTAY